MSASVRRACGFTLVEFLVVVVAICILAGVAFDRLLPLIGRAQRAAFMQTRADLQSALLLEAADRITRGETQSLVEFANANPMALLLQPPANYVGAIVGSDDDAVLPRASWSFDERAHRLVYRVGRYARFDGLEGPADRIELSVALVYADRDGNGAFDAARDRFEGLKLDAVSPYSWPE